MLNLFVYSGVQVQCSHYINKSDHMHLQNDPVQWYYPSFSNIVTTGQLTDTTK